MNQKTSKVEKEFYLRCSYLTLSVLFDKEPINIRVTAYFCSRYSLIAGVVAVLQKVKRFLS